MPWEELDLSLLANAAMDQIFDAFPDHEPTLRSEFDDCWIFQLKWTADPRAFVDAGAQSAAQRLYGLSLSEVGGYREEHRCGGRDVVISMVHSWALLAPARSFIRRGRCPLSWVVHLDDHTDLSPLLAEPLSQSGSLRDYIFGTTIDLGDPKSVIAAVERGAVNKGNFLTAYILAYPECRTVHVGRNVVERDLKFSHQLDVIELGGRQITGHRLRLDPSFSEGTWNFQQRRSLPIDLPVGPHDGIWLDIDLDFFCNRYDGDSDKRSKVALLGEGDEVRRQVDQFMTELYSVEWLTRIEAVSIAVSPGFFPAEYWAEVIGAIHDGIRNKLGD